MSVFASKLGKPANMLPLEIRSIKKDSPVVQHLVACCGTLNNFEWLILDACRGDKKN